MIVQHVGDSVGIAEGTVVGSDVVGEMVGDAVGTGTVGEVVGGEVGLDVVGDVVGDDDGEEVVGETLGDVVGNELVGDKVGDVVGLDVDGETDGDAVGVDRVGDRVGDDVGSAVVGDAVGDVVGTDVLGEAVGEKEGLDVVGDSVGDAVGEETVGSSVGETVGAAVVGATVGDAVGATVGFDAVGLTVGDVLGLADGSLDVGCNVGRNDGETVGESVGELDGAHVPQSAGHTSYSSMASQYASTRCRFSLCPTVVGDTDGANDTSSALRCPHIVGQMITVSGSQASKWQNGASPTVGALDGAGRVGGPLNGPTVGVTDGLLVGSRVGVSLRWLQRTGHLSRSPGKHSTNSQNGASLAPLEVVAVAAVVEPTDADVGGNISVLAVSVTAPAHVSGQTSGASEAVQFRNRQNGGSPPCLLPRRPGSDPRPSMRFAKSKLIQKEGSGPPWQIPVGN